MCYCVEMTEKDIPKVEEYYSFAYPDVVNLFTDDEQEICEQVFKTITERRLPTALLERLDAHDQDYLHEFSREIGRFWTDFRRDKGDFPTFRRDYRDAIFSGDNVKKKDIFGLMKSHFVESNAWVAAEIKDVDVDDHGMERNLTRQQTRGDGKGTRRKTMTPGEFSTSTPLGAGTVPDFDLGLGANKTAALDGQPPGVKDLLGSKWVTKPQMTDMVNEMGGRLLTEVKTEIDAKWDEWEAMMEERNKIRSQQDERDRKQDERDRRNFFKSIFTTKEEKKETDDEFRQSLESLRAEWSKQKTSMESFEQRVNNRVAGLERKIEGGILTTTRFNYGGSGEGEGLQGGADGGRPRLTTFDSYHDVREFDKDEPTSLPHSYQGSDSRREESEDLDYDPPCDGYSGGPSDQGPPREGNRGGPPDQPLMREENRGLPPFQRGDRRENRQGYQSFPKPKWPTFTGSKGKTSWETFRIQFEQAAHLSRMDAQQRVLQFGLCLQDEAANYFATLENSRRHQLDSIFTDFETLFGESDSEENYQVKLSKAVRTKDETLSEFAQRIVKLARGAYPGNVQRQDKAGIEAFLNGCGLPAVAFQVKMNGYTRNGVKSMPGTTIEAARAVRDVSLKGGLITGQGYNGPDIERPDFVGRVGRVDKSQLDRERQGRTRSPARQETIEELKRQLANMRAREEAFSISKKLMETGAASNKSDADALGRAAATILTGAESETKPNIQPRLDNPPSKACYECQATDHIARDCPKRGANQSDWRGGPGRRGDRSPSPGMRNGCRHCGSKYHRSDMCNRSERGQSPFRDHVCEECGRRGHTPAFCWQKSRGASRSPARTCHNCGSENHLKWECDKPYRPGGRARSQSPISCWNCQETGHRSTECPRNIICEKCKTPGHKARRCPEIACMGCGGMGHMQFDCPTRK